MLSADFPQTNTTFGPPKCVAESQCKPLRAYCGAIKQGSLEGAKLVVTAWRPTTEELLLLNAGGTVFVSCLGGLPPHFVTANFQDATHPA